MGKQPNLNLIDEEIRDLVSLLNKAPFLETCSSCSGHPDINGHPKMLQREWRDGWITMRPIFDAGQLFSFLDFVRSRLDNTRHSQLYWVAEEDTTFHVHRTLTLFKQVGGEALYASAVPILTTGFLIGIWPLTTFSKALLMWNIVLSSTQEFLSFPHQALPPIETPKAGADTFVKFLQSVPHIQEVKQATANVSRGLANIIYRSYLHPNSCQQVEIWFLWNRASFKWGWDFMNYLKTHLNREESLSPIRFQDVVATLTEKEVELLNENEDAFQRFHCGVPQFFLEGRFQIKPIVKQSNLRRTREDHLKIWKLIELAVQEWLHGEAVASTCTKAP